MHGAADRGTGSRRSRLDKWLWAARFYKTRSLAAQAITAGQVHIDGERVKPAHEVKQGQRITLRRTGLVWDVVVTSVADRRGNAAAAALLYAEIPEAVAAREDEILRRRAAAAVTPKWPGRPTKRERRKLRELLGSLG